MVPTTAPTLTLLPSMLPLLLLPGRRSPTPSASSRPWAARASLLVPSSRLSTARARRLALPSPLRIPTLLVTWSLCLMAVSAGPMSTWLGLSVALPRLLMSRRSLSLVSPTAVALDPALDLLPRLLLLSPNLLLPRLLMLVLLSLLLPRLLLVLRFPLLSLTSPRVRLVPLSLQSLTL